MKKNNSESATPAGGALTIKVTRLGRRDLIRSTISAGAMGLAVSRGFGVLEAQTPTPTDFSFFETPARSQTPATQWLFASGDFTWSQALRLPLSTAITDQWGQGWLLAQMIKPQDFPDAAMVTKKAMGDLRGKRGPFIGVVQAQGAGEPRDGFFNLDGSTPFLTWGKYDPNDGASVHRNILREEKFRKALLEVSKEVLDYWHGKGTADRFKDTIDFIISEVSKPEGGRPKDDVVALWHEKDGSMTAGDVNAQTFYPVLMSRRKPQPPQSPGRLPSWPKVNKTVDLADGMKVARRSTLSWRWTQGAQLGMIQVIDLGTGTMSVDRQKASSSSLDLTILRPGNYLFRTRNITKYADPWLEIGFVIV